VVVTTVEAGRGEGGTAVEGGLGDTALGAGGVFASLSRASMMKGTVGAGEVFLGALWRGESKSVAVGALGIAVSLPRFLDLKVF